MLFASICAALVWLLRPPTDAGVLAVSFGVTENLLTLVAVLVTAAVVHVGLGWVGAAVHPAFASHRGIVMGLLGAISGAAASVSGIAGAHPVK